MYIIYHCANVTADALPRSCSSDLCQPSSTCSYVLIGHLISLLKCAKGTDSITPKVIELVLRGGEGRGEGGRERKRRSQESRQERLRGEVA